MEFSALPTTLQSKTTVCANGCWTWTGALVESRRGVYGKVQYQGKTWRVHRLTFVLAGGELKDPPHRWHVDHICGETLCVNPAHLQLLYYWDNIAKSGGRGAAGMNRKGVPEHVHDAREQPTDPAHCYGSGN